MLRSISSVVGIMCKGHGCEYGIYAQLVSID